MGARPGGDRARTERSHEAEAVVVARCICEEGCHRWVHVLVRGDLASQLPAGGWPCGGRLGAGTLWNEAGSRQRTGFLAATAAHIFAQPDLCAGARAGKVFRTLHSDPNGARRFRRRLLDVTILSAII